MNSDLIQKATSIIEANYSDEHFGPIQLANEIGTSHITLYRHLKKASGKTISRFIRDIRLEKAREILLNDELTISEIAYKVGFGSATYFNRCFHEFYGISPSDYKKEQQRKDKKETVKLDNVKQKRRFLRLVVLLVTMLVVILFLLTKFSILNKKSVPDKSIAVLPVRNLGNPDSEYVADGIGEGIINKLSKIEDLRVVDVSTVKEYISNRGENEMGKDLGINAFLRTTFQVENDVMVLFVSLINAEDGTIMFSEKYPASSDGIFSLQSKIAQTVAQELNVKITPEEKEQIVKIPSVNTSANDYYLRGKDKQWEYYLNGDQQAFQDSKQYFLLALKLDSNYAPIYTGLALLMWYRAEWRNTLPENHLDSILNLAEKALSLDKNISEAYFIKGEYYRLKGRNDRALTEYDKALDINPNDWMVFWGKARLYAYSDNLKALYFFNEAASRHKGTMYPKLLRGLGSCYANLGFFEKRNYYDLEAFKLDNDSGQFFFNTAMIEKNNQERIITLKKALSTEPTNTTYLWYLIHTYSFINEDSTAFRYLKTYLKLMGTSDNLNINRTHRIGYVYFKMGLHKEAEFYFDLQEKTCLEAINSGRYYSNFLLYDLAAVYAFKGQKEKAYYYLHQFNKMEKIPYWFTQLINTDPLFNTIQKEPEFQNIISEVEAKFNAEHEHAKLWLEENDLL